MRAWKWMLTAVLGGAMSFAQAPHPRPAGSYLGIQPQDVTADRVVPLKLGEARGAEVVLVDQDAPAGRAGVQEHDVILSFNGQKVGTAQGLRQLLRRTRPGSAVTLGISRAGHAMNVALTLASRRQTLAASPPGGLSNSPAAPIPIRDSVFPQLSIVPCWGQDGMLVENITPQLGRSFGVRNNTGVLVRAVALGSMADNAGVRAGDVITRVNGAPAASGAEWFRRMRERHGGPVSLTLVRARRPRTLTMNMPDPRNPDVRNVDALYSYGVPNLELEWEGLQMEWNRVAPDLQRSLAAERARAAREIERAMQEFRQEWQQAQPQTPERQQVALPQ